MTVIATPWAVVVYRRNHPVWSANGWALVNLSKENYWKWHHHGMDLVSNNHGRQALDALYDTSWDELCW